MIADEKLATLVDSLVIPDRRSAAANVDKDATLKTLTAILKGGAKSIDALADILVESGKGDDSKARYALHALAVHVGGLCEDSEKRQSFVKGLVATVTKDRPREVRGFLVRQLQVVGGPEAVRSLGTLLANEELCDEAAQALLAIKAGAAEQFRDALVTAIGKCRLTVVHGLGTLCDTESAAALRTLVIREKDQDTRLVTVWALANMGDAESADVLLKLADVEGYQRGKVTGACLLLAERLVEAGKKDRAERIYKFIEETRTEPNEKHFREAATRGREALK